MAADRLVELKKIFLERGLSPNKRLGQNFCIDPNLLASIPYRAGVEKGDFILEIGTGTGLLTNMLAERAAFVYSVEIDERMLSVARTFNAPNENVEFALMDVLERKSRLNQDMLNRIDEIFSTREFASFRMISNLPYVVATPVIMNFMFVPRRPDSMTFLIQKELALKMTARPGRKRFGPLSIIPRVYYEPRIIRFFPPSVFWPRPKVSSALVRLDALETPLPVADFDYFGEFVRTLFNNRRKNIKNVLTSKAFSEPVINKAEEVLSDLGIEPERRAESVSVNKLVDMCNRFRDIVDG